MMPAAWSTEISAALFGGGVEVTCTLHHDLGASNSPGLVRAGVIRLLTSTAWPAIGVAVAFLPKSVILRVTAALYVIER